MNKEVKIKNIHHLTKDYLKSHFFKNRMRNYRKLIRLDIYALLKRVFIHTTS